MAAMGASGPKGRGRGVGVSRLAKGATGVAVLLAASLWAVPGLAVVVEVTADDGKAPLAEVVVSLHPAAATSAAANAVMDQRDSTFVPGVLAVQAGTTVSFPNSDTVRHQVYSFSPAKPFELPLYEGTPLAPVLFDRPGVVVVGCNIHDWMIGYIVVLDTPHFAKTDASGRLRIDLPAGRYRLQAWHSRGVGEPVSRRVDVPAAGLSQAVSLALGPPPVSRRGSDRLRDLQERFRRLERDP